MSILSNQEILLRCLHDPAVRAFLDTIAYAEGTLGKNGYKLLFGKIVHNDLSKHPNLRICCKSGKKKICSTAAGRYQLCYKIWKKWLSKALRTTEFTPFQQDRAAIRLIIDRNALKSIQKRQLAQAFHAVRNVWASLPGNNYRQPKKSLRELLTVFRKRYAYQVKHGYTYTYNHDAGEIKSTDP